MRYEKLTHKVIGCAMKVHTTLGKWLSGSDLPESLGD